MTLSIRSNGYQNLAHGTLFHMGDSESFQFQLQFDEFSFTLNIQFLQSEEKKVPLWSVYADPELAQVNITCINFNEALGRGILNPIEVATFNGKKVYFLFWTYRYGNEEGMVRKLEYNFYQEI